MNIPDFNSAFLIGPTPETLAAVRAERDAATTHSLLRGDSLFNALCKSVNDLKDRAPAEHDVLVEAFGINVVEVGFLEPHAFLLRGYDDAGNNTYVVAHFSQLVTRVVYLPKRGPERVITGFWRNTAE
jgi:hypothetical protein